MFRDPQSNSTIDHEGATEPAGIQWPEITTEPYLPMAVTERWLRADLIPDTIQDVVPF